MQRPFMRVPHTGPLPPPIIVPASAASLYGASAALRNFLTAPPSHGLANPHAHNDKTVVLTGAGVSVASGLADYRGPKGTYTLNRSYRPIYFNEFCENHEARKRYWARSFLGWPNSERSRPNAAHYALKDLAEHGLISSIITQNVDSLHARAHPDVHTIELHGYLRSLVCLSCRHEYSRSEFQHDLKKLNPTWAHYLAQALESGALSSEDPKERKQKGMNVNPDGDVDVPGAPYTTFRYPACPVCLESPPTLSNGDRAVVNIDTDGAWLASSNAGILKPAVIMFGESIPAAVKRAVELAVDEASRILVVGSSLATYSAMRLVKRAKENGMPIGIVNTGGVRGEEDFFKTADADNDGSRGFRCDCKADEVLARTIETLKDDHVM